MTEILQSKLARKYLKMKLIEDKWSFRGHDTERSHLRELLSRTVESGESNSAIVIGPRGAGKSTLINSLLAQFTANENLRSNSILVRLNGNLHCDDRTALKAITTQMSLDNVIGDKVFGSFSENLAFLLSCLKSGHDKHCKSVIFILEEFDLFCHTHGSQTLLYNLFDVAQSKQAPICVIGITCRLDVIELLEKRVKSRFSHRQIFLFPDHTTDEESFDKRINHFCSLLSLPLEIKSKSSKNNAKLVKANNTNKKELEDNNCLPDMVLIKCKCSWKDFQKFDQLFLSSWNKSIYELSQNNIVQNCLRRMYDLDVSEEHFKLFLISVVCRINDDHPQIDIADIVEETKLHCDNDDRISTLLSLSILEISLIIAMKHQSEIFVDQPMNFEMIYNRYSKFASCNSSSQIVPKAVVLKAFEHLRSLELLTPIKDSGLGCGYVQKEFQMYKLLITEAEISEAINSFNALPTELVQWASSSLI